MADFHVFTGDEVIATELPGLLNTNFNSIKSDFAGTAFPTSNLVVGMTCYRTDQKKVYRLMSDLSTWKLESDLNYDGGLPIATQAEAEALADNTKVMTPLRTKQSIAKQVFGGGSVVPTTSGGTGNANGIAPSADKLATARYINGVSFNGTANITNYVECTTAAATVAKTVTVTGFSLVKGASIRVKFTNGNTAASPTLNVNSTGAKSIMYLGYALRGSSSEITADSVYELCYDGSYWRLMSEVGMTGASASSAGKAGLVPQPKAGDNDKFLCGDGSFKEAGKVKSVNGKTGDVVVDLPVGHMYWSVEPSVPAGRLPAMGATYNRSLYADLWAWANSVGLVKSESEWQAIASANGGNCAYYSSGDGSSTFRVPKLPTSLVTDASDGEVPVVGNGKALGLTSGSTDYGLTIKYNSSVGSRLSGYTSSLNVNAGTKTSTTGDFAQDVYAVGVSTNPNNSNLKAQIHSTKITGQWLIVAFGVAHNIGEADVANVMQAVEQVQTGLSTLEQGVGTAIDYIIESYQNGTSWYRKWKSGWLEQGGLCQQAGAKSYTRTFLKPFSVNPHLTVNPHMKSNTETIYTIFGHTVSTTGFSAYVGTTTDIISWYACGQGA